MAKAALDDSAKQRCRKREKPDEGRFASAVSLSRIQKLIGQRMLASKRNKPCFYIESKADVTELMGQRQKFSKSLGVRVTSNAFLIRALARAAKAYPFMIGRLDSGDCGDNIRIADAVNVGFAVNAPQGVIVPVIKDADKKTLAEIAHEEKLFTEKTRSNKLTLKEMEGETIALSNLGAYGIDSFIGIVPPPATTILAVGNVLPMVIPENGRAVVRKIVRLTLAVDRRIVESTYAARFLKFITEQLEEPQQLA